MTSIDRQLIHELDPAHVVAAGHRDAFRHALRAGRCKKLEALGLAERLGGGRWKLDERLEERLRAMGERGDIIRTMQRTLSTHGMERPPGDRVIHERGATAGPIVGQLLARGLSDELADRHYLVIDAIDGRLHHIDIGRGDAVGPLGQGSIVRVSPVTPVALQADRTIAQIAAANGGRYSLDIHLRHDPSASEEFARAHLRRLEAIRRGSGAAERLADGSWRISPDYLEQAGAFEVRIARSSPFRVELLSPLPLQELVAAGGATWLDKELVSSVPEPLRDAGFGREARSALALRRQWLMEEQLVREGPDGPLYPDDLLATLRRRELLRVAAGTADELRLDFLEMGRGMRFEGCLERRLDLASGQFALVAGNREFVMVPWRQSLERQIGRELEVKIGSRGVGWTIGRGRSGPEIG